MVAKRIISITYGLSPVQFQRRECRTLSTITCVLFVIVWLSHCLVSILLSYVNCSEWVWRVGCTLVYRPWPTSSLSRPDQFGRGNIIVQRLGHVDKADCLSLLASLCICLNIVCAGLNSFYLLFSKMWERLETSPLPSLIGQLSESA